ncbi:MAG: methionine--tRNA ligase [Patescibacteria group bacterium]
MVTYEQFSALDLRVGTIIEAEPVIDADRLLRLVIDLGHEERQVVAGIAEEYEAEKLIGTQVVLIVNLESREIKGLESQGMILAASGDNGPVILMPEKPVADGTTIK